MSEEQKIEAKREKNERAIAVCGDILKWLSVLKPRRGVYCRSYGKASLPTATVQSPNGVDLSQFVDVATMDCEVCMKGAAFLSHVRLFKHFPLEDAIQFMPTYYEVTAKWHVSSSVIEQLLIHSSTPDFTEEQFDLMEAAFEGQTIKDKEGILFRYCPEGWVDGRKMMEAICKNVIRNDGWFCPEQEAVYCMPHTTIVS